MAKQQAIAVSGKSFGWWAPLQCTLAVDLVQYTRHDCQGKRLVCPKMASNLCPCENVGMHQYRLPAGKRKILCNNLKLMEYGSA